MTIDPTTGTGGTGATGGVGDGEDVQDATFKKKGVKRQGDVLVPDAKRPELKPGANLNVPLLQQPTSGMTGVEYTSFFKSSAMVQALVALTIDIPKAAKAMRPLMAKLKVLLMQKDMSLAEKMAEWKKEVASLEVTKAERSLKTAEENLGIAIGAAIGGLLIGGLVGKFSKAGAMGGSAVQSSITNVASGYTDMRTKKSDLKNAETGVVQAMYDGASKILEAEQRHMQSLLQSLQMDEKEINEVMDVIRMAAELLAVRAQGTQNI
jgi:hypothetical protein